MLKPGTVGDYILPLAVIAVVGMMIFPMPPAVLDFLLMVNITFAISLLISTVYLRESDNFTSLPSILLLSTLFRLGLNISTTRQVLSGNEPPQIVSAFGHFVVGSNLVVGMVIFMIITIVQFIVISKGAERIAEVAARFTLDAMPGKQMAIDADVRAGLLSLSDAKIKRIELYRESKLYGALDGAMKFVKGDAIAGLLITLLNISAGFILGVTQQGLRFEEAVKKYSLLTVGDGLVSQIPALLVAVAAGIAVSRVSDSEDSYVGRDIIRQVARDPRSLLVTAAVLLGLAIVPALPTLLFLVVAIFLGITGMRMRGKNVESANNDAEVIFKPKVYSALVVKLSAEAAIELHKNVEFINKVGEIRQDIFKTWGIIIPEIELDIDLNEKRFYAGMFLNSVKQFEYTCLTTEASFSDILQKHLRDFTKSHLSEFVNDTQIRLLLETYSAYCDDLINSTVPEIITVTGLTTLIRELLQEGVSVKEFPTILQAIAEFKFKLDGGSIGISGDINNAKLLSQISSPPRGESVNQRNSDLLTEIRIALRRSISEQSLKGKTELSVIIIHPLLDRVFSVAAYSQVPVAPSLIDQLNQKLLSFIEERGEEDVVIVSSRYARLCIAKTIRASFPKLRVLADEEICDDLKINIIGVVGGGIAEGQKETTKESAGDEIPEAMVA